MKIRFFFIILSILIVQGLFAQTPDWLWAENAGGSNADEGKGITTDADGNVYTTGIFRETAYFGPDTLISDGWTDIFVSKMDAYDNWLWTEKAGGSSSLYSYGICTDADDNIYVTGCFVGTVNFGSFTLIGSNDAENFIAKINTEGNWLWAEKAHGSGIICGYAISTDADGSVYTTGVFDGRAYFGPDTLTSSSADWDIFIAKMDTVGNWLWAENAGGSSTDEGRGITTDADGNVYTTGNFDSTASFGSFNLTSNGSSDIFISKMDADGNWLWAENAGGSSTDEGRGITTDADGNVYTTGNFDGSANFGSFNLTSNGYSDIFVAKMDTDGNWFWAENAGGSNADEGRGITTDADGNVYTTGFVRYTAYFGPYTVDCGSGFTDIFVAKMDTDGNWLWADIADGSGGDMGNSICTDVNANIFLTGHFAASASFGSHILTTNGNRDVFIARFGFNLDANFESDSIFGYLPFTVNFEDLSLGNIVDWQWDFQNDGVIDSYEQSPSFTYTNEGIYDVKLIISDGTLVDSLIKYNYITVEYVPPAPPTNVQVDIVYPDAVISWTAVDTTIYGTPITPDGYIILYNETPYEDEQFYYFLDFTTDLTYTHTFVAQHREQMFYKVVAYVDFSGEHIDYLMDLKNSQERVRWSDVKRNLKQER